jgi:hypothetical protein
MKEDAKGCILEYLIYLLESFFYIVNVVVWFLLLNSWWIFLAIILGVGISLVCGVIDIRTR